MRPATAFATVHCGLLGAPADCTSATKPRAGGVEGLARGLPRRHARVEEFEPHRDASDVLVVFQRRRIELDRPAPGRHAKIHLFLLAKHVSPFPSSPASTRSRRFARTPHTNSRIFALTCTGSGFEAFGTTTRTPSHPCQCSRKDERSRHDHSAQKSALHVHECNTHPAQIYTGITPDRVPAHRRTRGITDAQELT